MILILKIIPFSFIFTIFNCIKLYVLSKSVNINSNKNGVLLSQTCMRIEMRLRCFLVI